MRTRSRQHAIMMAPTHWHVVGVEGSFLKPEDQMLQEEYKLQTEKTNHALAGGERDSE